MGFKIEIYNQYSLEEKKYNVCPICSHLRSEKNKNKRCLLTDWEMGIATCQHCRKVLQIHKYKGHKDKLDFYVPRVKKVKAKGSYHTEMFFNKLHSKCDYQCNNLSIYLSQYFWIRDVIQAEEKLKIFSTNDFYENSICYSYINHKGQVTGVKVMAYNQNGSRKKNRNGFGLVNWMHKIYKIENWVNDFCLFGLHQISYRNEKVVHIVESEKTAFIMTMVKPKYIWLATGGLTMLNKQKLMPLSDYKIVLHPDKGDAFKVWKEFADQLKAFDIITSRITEDNPFIKDKGDLADYFMLLTKYEYYKDISQ